MSHIINSLFTSFSLYSRIPVPQTEWKEENRRYVLSFFPLVGAVTGALEYLLFRSFPHTSHGLLYAVLSAVIPVVITGGIHLDGFCDVNDALASYAPPEKALEIMHDPHIGSFAIIRLCLYLLMQCAFFHSLTLCTDPAKACLVVCAGYVLSRALSAVCVFTFRCVSKGMLETVNNRRKTNLAVSVIWAVLSSALMIYISPACGGAAVLCSLGVVAYYRLMSYKRFGGINGDLAGWFLQMCEIFILGAAAVMGYFYG